MKRSHLVILTVISILLIDQIIKIWVKTNMAYGQEILIFGQEWARIHFVENDGMAFGWKYGGSTGKLLLSLFRIVAVAVLIRLLYGMIQCKEPKGLIVCFGFILAGAIGNIIDSAFYGLCFSESTYGQVAEWFPESGPSRGFLFGKVVDMFYFPLIGADGNSHWPEWMPYFGGKQFQFFRPVFNFADSAITIGVASILIFHRSFFMGKSTEEVLAPGSTGESTNI